MRRSRSGSSASEDIFAALFFFVFGLSIDVGAIGDVGWLPALVVPASVGKIAAGHVAGKIGGFSARQTSTPASR